MDALSPLLAWLDARDVTTVLRAGLFAVLGLLAFRLVGRSLLAPLSRTLGAHQGALVSRVASWAVLSLFLMTTLHQLGFQLGVLLGAAGVLTVVVGFASQTSASNLVSGLFLLAERPFSVTDIVRVGDATGEVLAIDLLSVKLRTFDNLYVRVPNETVIKTQVTNLTRFAIRRIDMPIGVAYKENLSRVEEILLEIADREPLCLEEPRPLFMVLGFGDSAVNLQLSVWCQRENFLAVRNAVLRGILDRFATEKIEIPFPHRTLYAGATTEPLPVRVLP